MAADSLTFDSVSEAAWYGKVNVMNHFSSTEEIHNFIIDHPSHPRSSQLIFCLSNDVQRELVLSLIENAAFCDSWEAYFDLAAVEGLEQKSEVAYEAVQNVGLDPLSAPLWIAAAGICQDENEARELYHYGLSVPLVDWNSLHSAYMEFEAKHGKPPLAVINNFHFLQEEKWPDRYANVDSEEKQREILVEWELLLFKLEEELYSDALDGDVQLRRIDLALRQMCIQLPKLDVCYYQYAFFQAKIMHDSEGAISTITSGLKKVGENSFALKNLLQVLRKDGNEGLQTDSGNIFGTLSLMRATSEKMIQQGPTPPLVKVLRNCGKAAAGRGISDWKVYSQWFMSEYVVAKDPRMAAKVLENGSICCSSSPLDSVLLKNEAIDYHLFQHNETATRGCTKQLVELSKNSKVHGREVEAWNTLMRVEEQLGSSMDVREKDLSHTHTTFMDSFLNRFRVGVYAPCSPYVAKWLSVSRDFRTSWDHEHNTVYDNAVPASRQSISFRKRNREVDLVTPQCSEWKIGKLEGKPSIPDADNPDEVVGPRSYRGRLVFSHLQLDLPTKLRMEKQKKLKARQDAKRSQVSFAQHGPIGRLAQQLRRIPLTEEQIKKEQSVSFDWIYQKLAPELNLNANSSRPHQQT